MMDLEINDLDFYQTDYTNASAWESFNFNLEEKLNILRNFRDFQDLKATGKWSTKREQIQLQELPIEITLYCTDRKSSPASRELPDVLQDGNFNFSGDVQMEEEFSLPPLWKWYGLSSFIVVGTKEDDVIPEHHLKTIQSSITMAVSELNCSIPVFLRVMHKKANMFLGLADDAHVRTNFDMVYLRALPANYKCFTGLHEIFKGKVGLSSDPIQVAVRVGFSSNNNDLKDFLELGRQSEPDELRYPFGIRTDPIKQILLHCVWPELPTSVVLHNYTNFDVTKATDWVLQCVFDENSIESLADCIEEFTDELNNKDVLITDDRLSLLPGGFPSPRNTWSKLRSDKPSDNFLTIPDDVVKKFLYYLFPDADDGASPKGYDFGPKISLSKLKTGPKDCLIHRLALVLSLSYANYDGAYGLKCFFTEFFNEIRYRVDHSIAIPGIAEGFPDYHTCLLHQKLQMVNVCIERRRQRTAKKRDSSAGSSRVAAENSEDEFYDCEEDESVLIKPSGRLSPLGDLHLVGHPDEPLYIPETQDAVVKTEDELEKDADVMLKLGPGSDLSSQMMSLSLQSDMESFKAANPRAKIEDFIRWYSPRDWIEGEAPGGQGEISERMKIPGNTWQTVWAAAKPISAKKQKCLFDDAKEVEKVMCYLEQLKIGELVLLVLPCLMEDAFSTLSTELDGYKGWLLRELVEKRVPMLYDLVCKYSREFWNVSSHSAAGLKWKYAIHEIRLLESSVSRMKSLHEKLNVAAVPEESEIEPQQKLLQGLMSGQPTVVSGGPANEKWREILHLFSQQSHETEGTDVSSAETEREFVFRMEKSVAGERDNVILPQFMRVLLRPTSNEYRICGAFSQHVNIVYE